ncbi:MAG: CHAT domain-containing protein [Chloroflexi bacterium]|nr:CHAT domain-containing protein [Chloroflexota bacterium]
MTQPTVFISYSHKDEKEKNILLTYLNSLKARGVKIWSDDQIKAGANTEESISQAIKQAKMAILLITADYLASDNIDRQTSALKERYKKDNLAIIPIIAKHCPWNQYEWLASMKVLPRSKQPVWRDSGEYVNEELTAIVNEVADILGFKKPSPPPDDIPTQQPRQSTISSPTFEIKIARHGPVMYKAEIDSPAGEATATFKLPLDKQTIDTTLAEFRTNLKNTRRLSHDQSFTPKDAKALTPEHLGSTLFQNIFQDKVMGLYKESRRQAKRARKPLSIILNIDPKAGDLINLPWEFLCDTSDQRFRGHFLAFGQDTPIIRRWLKAEKVEFSYDPPLRVLLISATPEESGPLNVPREYRLIRDQLTVLNRGNQAKVRIDYQPAATLNDLKKIVRDPRRTPHIFHFMGHGGLGSLLMEDELGGQKSVSEQSLSIILRNAPSLRLVVLNACETTQADFLEEQLGVAQSLADADVPAIVAMQFAISDKAALVFAKDFYQVIAEGASIDTAVTWGRIAIQTEFEESATKEWGTPVLYLQSPDGHIFTDLLGEQPKHQKKTPEEDVEEAADISEQGKEQPQTSKTEQMRREAAEKAAEIEHLQQLRQEKKRRLQEREIQKAKYGIDTSPHITLEIADIRQEIDEIEQKLIALEPEIPLHDTTPVPVTTRPVSVQGIDDSKAFDVSKTDDSGVHSEGFKLYTQGRAALEKEEWGQALGYLSRAQKLASGLPDIDNFVTQARQQWRQTVEGQSEDASLEVLYSQTQQYLAQSDPDLEKVALLLERIVRSDAGFKDDVYDLALETRTRAEKEKAEREKQAKLEMLYAQAQVHRQEENWSEAVDSLTQIIDIDDAYLDAQPLLHEATKQRDLLNSYQQGKTHFKKKDWAKSVAAFGKVASIDPDYHDAAKLLRLSRHQKQLDTWIKEAEDYLEAKEWEAAIEVLEENRIVAERTEAGIPLNYAYAQRSRLQRDWGQAVEYLKAVIEDRPNYRPDLNTLYEQVNEERRLQQQFEKATAHIEQNEWATAKATLESIVQTRPDYPLAQDRLQEVNEEIRLAGLYKKALDLIELKQWAKAIPHLQQIPDYEDARTLLKEAQKQVELDAFYKDGLEAAGQGHWQEAVTAFERVDEIDPGYRETQHQLETARNKIILQQSYDKGMAALEAGRQAHNLAQLDEAVGWLDTAVEIDRRFRGAENRLREAKRERSLLWHYRQGEGAFQNEQWAEAINHWQVIVKDENEPGYHGDSARRLAEAERQQRLANSYIEAYRHFKAEEWDNAIILLEQLQQETPGENYKDTAKLRTEAKIQQQLFQHYHQAEQMMTAEQWDKAIQHLQQIQAARAEYRQVEVERMLAEAQTNHNAAGNYQTGLKALEAERWAEAVTAFDRAFNLKTDFRDVETRLNQARQQQTLHRHYQAAMGAMANEAWDEAIERLVAIQGLDPDFKDARRQLEEAECQRQLAVDYQAALAHIEAERWAEARTAFDNILARQKDYKKSQAHRDQAQTHLDMAGRYERAEKKIELAGEQPEHWQSVVELLTTVVEWQADYREDAQVLLAEAQQQAELHLLYQRATVLGLKNDILGLEQAIDLLAQIIQIDLDYRDAVSLKAECEDKLNQKKEEERRAKVKVLHDLAVNSARKGDFTQVFSCLEQITLLDKQYKTVQNQVTELIQQCQAKFQQGQQLKAQGEKYKALAILKEYNQEIAQLPVQLQTILSQNLPN